MVYRVEEETTLLVSLSDSLGGILSHTNIVLDN